MKNKKSLFLLLPFVGYSNAGMYRNSSAEENESNLFFPFFS
jgi:hypothetical protein